MTTTGSSSGSSGSYKDILTELTNEDSKMDTLDFSHLKSSGDIDQDMCSQIFDALADNSVVTTVTMDNLGIGDGPMQSFANMLAKNESVTFVDIGYNKISGKGFETMVEALSNNKTLTQLKIHRQQDDMGTKTETELVKIWNTNVTLQRLFVTLHDRNCNQLNTRGEVRNVKIANCVAKGEDFLHLDPNRKKEYKEFMKKEKEEKKERERIANLPISCKIESTGGPYTLKQLTSNQKYWPDDVDRTKRETYLSDEDFLELFGVDKDTFAGYAKWKRQRMKKEKKLM